MAQQKHEDAILVHLAESGEKTAAALTNNATTPCSDQQERPTLVQPAQEKPVVVQPAPRSTVFVDFPPFDVMSTLAGDPGASLGGEATIVHFYQAKGLDVRVDDPGCTATPLSTPTHTFEATLPSNASSTAQSNKEATTTEQQDLNLSKSSIAQGLALSQRDAWRVQSANSQVSVVRSPSSCSSLLLPAVIKANLKSPQLVPFDATTAVAASAQSPMVPQTAPERRLSNPPIDWMKVERIGYVEDEEPPPSGEAPRARSPVAFPLVDERALLADGPFAPHFLPRPSTKTQRKRGIPKVRDAAELQDALLASTPSPAVQLANMRRLPRDSTTRKKILLTPSYSRDDSVSSPIQRPKTQQERAEFVAQRCRSTASLSHALTPPPASTTKLRIDAARQTQRALLPELYAREWDTLRPSTRPYSKGGEEEV